MTILVTGFEPFGRWEVNSSGMAVEALAEFRRDVIAEPRLPVDYERAAGHVRHLIRVHRPRAVLLTGLANGNACRVETLARPAPRPSHPAVRAGRWPVADTLAALRAVGIPARVSRNAGRFVCDNTFWTALGEPGPQHCVFLHVPPLGGSWTAARLARGLDAVIGALTAREAG